MRSASEMTGKLSLVPWVSSMSLAHFSWLPSPSTERPITFTPRLSNSPFSFATRPSSVVQTGVKSFGWENNTPQPFPSHWWKSSFPSVVSAEKSGATSPSLSVMCWSLLLCQRFFALVG